MQITESTPKSITIFDTTEDKILGLHVYPNHDLGFQEINTIQLSGGAFRWFAINGQQTILAFAEWLHKLPVPSNPDGICYYNEVRPNRTRRLAVFEARLSPPGNTRYFVPAPEESKDPHPSPSKFTILQGHRFPSGIGAVAMWSADLRPSRLELAIKESLFYSGADRGRVPVESAKQLGTWIIDSLAGMNQDDKS